MESQQTQRTYKQRFVRRLKYILPVAFILSLLFTSTDEWPEKFAWMIRFSFIPCGTLIALYYAEYFADQRGWAQWAAGSLKFVGMLVGICITTTITTVILDEQFNLPASTFEVVTAKPISDSSENDSPSKGDSSSNTSERSLGRSNEFNQLDTLAQAADSENRKINIHFSTGSVDTAEVAQELGVDEDLIEVIQTKNSIRNYRGQLVANCVLGLFFIIPILIRDSRRQGRNLMLKSKELEIQKLKELKVKAELETLQAKINPHFLYNSLNSIASLIYSRPEAAESMVLGLSDLFRYSINAQGENLSTVESELQMVRTYLEIEQHRFGDNLTYQLEVEDKVRLKSIPRFLIQPLVENAIKHGIAKITKGLLRVQVKEMAEGGVEILVYDNGPAFSKELNTGYGLKSIQDKLDLLFPGKSSFQLNNGSEKHVRITLKYS